MPLAHISIVKTKLLLIFIFFSVLLGAQTLEPIHWSARLQPKADSLVCTLTAAIDPAWHLYATSLPEGGPVATSFTLNAEPITLRPSREPITVWDEVFMLSLGYYADSVSFSCCLPKDVAGQLSVQYMACDSMQCLPPTTYTVDLSALLAENKAHASVAKTDLLSLFLLGLLAGLLAIFTPCVWPIIPMTVSFFMHRHTTTGSLSAKQSAAIYGLSIVLIYVGLGLLVTLLFGASALNALSTNAVLNVIFFLILVVFALSFFGLFELNLPSSWSTRLDSRARSTSGILSLLFMAFTLVIVSFSCTGPIVGTLLVEAAGKSLLAPAVGMLGFSIALALPFTLFAAFPAWMNRLPKSGSWMTTFKVSLAFIELALSLKFLSVADLVSGWGILPRWLFLTLWILIFAAMAVYLLLRKKWLTSILGTLSMVFALYLVPGLWGAPVKLISAFAPPIEKKHTTITPQQVFALPESDKPILLEFSGYGCVNCRKMEAYVLADTAVARRLENYTVVTLFVDDHQTLAEPITVLDRGHERTLTTIGEYNSYVQTSLFGANAQPYYIQLSADGQKLSQPYAFSIDKSDFLQWLIY